MSPTAVARWPLAALRGAWLAPRYLGLGLIRAYQQTISPLLGPRCKYYPSCSHFGYEAVRARGLVVGSILTCWRILRCNPYSHGGIDDVPVRGEPLFRRAAIREAAASAALNNDEVR